jgi:hypothetical protein
MEILKGYDGAKKGKGRKRHLLVYTQGLVLYVKTNPTSFSVYKGSYAAEPEVVTSNSLVISWARDTRQDYGPYTIWNWSGILDKSSLVQAGV